MRFWGASNGGNCAGCGWVAAEGEITPETPSAFQEFIAEHGEPYLVHLHSPGGNLIAGIELGRLIREHGANTSIAKTVPMTEKGLSHWEKSEPGICASACAFAFMGGVDRYARPNELGVHQFYSSSDESNDQEMVQKLAGLSLFHVMQMGIDPRVMLPTSGTAPESVFWFSAEELKAFGLDTSSTNTEAWRLEPYIGGLVLTTVHRASASRSVAVTLFCRSEDQGWRLLLAEDDPCYEKQLNGKPLLDFERQYPVCPTITFGSQLFVVNSKDVEFERFVEGRVLVSIHLPRIVEVSGGLQIEFYPDLASAFGPLIYVSVALPENEWLEVAGRNCI